MAINYSGDTYGELRPQPRVALVIPSRCVSSYAGRAMRGSRAKSRLQVANCTKHTEHTELAAHPRRAANEGMYSWLAPELVVNPSLTTLFASASATEPEPVSRPRKPAKRLPVLLQDPRRRGARLSSWLRIVALLLRVPEGL